MLTLRATQGYLSFWNENISYVLRGCILMELSMRRRIDTFKEFAGRHHRRPFSDRLVEVVDERATGEVLLDEALKLMRAEQQARPVGVSGAGLLASGGKVLGTGRIGKAFSAAFGGSRAGASGSEASASTTTVPSETQTSRQSVSTWIDLMSGRFAVVLMVTE